MEPLPDIFSGPDPWGLESWMPYNRVSMLLPLTDFPDFTELKFRFRELKHSVKRILIEIHGDGIQVSAENETNDGFVFICQASHGDYTACYRLVNGGRPEEYRRHRGQIGNFIIEAARAVREFLAQIDEETVIRRLDISIDGESDENGEIVPPEDIIHDYRFVRYNFLMHLELSCLMTLRPRKISKLCMEFRGGWESRHDIWAVLPYVHMVEEKTVFFVASESKRDMLTELMLDKLFQMPARIKPEKIIVEEHFWMKVEPEHWAQFKEIRTVVKEMSVDTVKALVEHFCQSAVFEKCYIRLLTDNIDIRGFYHDNYNPVRRGPDWNEHSPLCEWTVPGNPFRFVVGVAIDMFTFEKKVVENN